MRKKRAFVTFPLVMIIFLILFILISAIIHFSSSYRLAVSVEDRLMTAVIDTATTNWTNIYSSVREGYSGAYSYNLNGFAESVSYLNTRQRINKYLNCNYRGEKYDDKGKLLFKISDIQTSIENVAYKDSTLNFKVKVKAKLEIPQELLNFRYNLVLNLNSSSKYSKIF